MKTMWSIASYEFKIQWRSLAFWLVAIGVSLFMYAEGLQGISSEAGLASGQNLFLVDIFGTEAQETMKGARFSTFIAWGLADELGLISALLLGVLGAFVWQRDRQAGMTDMLNARPFRSWQYVLGKYLGVVFSWGVMVVPLAILGIAWTFMEANRYGLRVAFADFPMPLIVWTLLTLAYGTAFVMAISLLVRNGTATLLIYLVYWGYSITDVRMLRGATTAKLFSHWLIRSGYSITRENLHVVQARFAELWLNRGLYLSLTVLILGLTVWLFDRFRRQGTLIGPGSDAE
jgi:ABC-type transport system involved in multi-copper enzyme maturation permease subunit